MNTYWNRIMEVLALVFTNRLNITLSFLAEKFLRNCNPSWWISNLEPALVCFSRTKGIYVCKSIVKE